MSIGKLLALWLLVIFLQAAAWGIVDAKVHREDEQTFTRWIIAKSKKSKRFAWTVLFCLFVSQALVVWLLFHFETLSFL